MPYSEQHKVHKVIFLNVNTASTAKVVDAVMPAPIVLKGIQSVAATAGTANASIVIQVDGTTVATVNVPANGVFATNLDVVVKAGQKLTIQGSGTSGGPTVTCWLWWRDHFDPEQLTGDYGWVGW